MSIYIDQSTVATGNAYLNQYRNPNCRFQTLNHYPNQATNLSTVSISTSDLLAAATSNISTAATNHLSTPINSNTTPEPSSNDIRSVIVVYQPIPSLLNSSSELCTWNLDTSHVQNPNSQHYLSLLVNPEDTTSNNMEFNQHIPTNTIPLATISSDKSLAAIFPFKLEENTPIPLFSGAALKEKPITAMYTDSRIDGHPIKLILDSRSAGSIITRQLMDQLAASTRIITADGATKTPIGEIDDFPIEINGIIVPIKVLVMDATQYQALVSNDWLFKTNAMLDWTTQELILSQNGRHTRVPAMCGHFKTINNTAPLIDFDEEKLKPTKYSGNGKKTKKIKRKEKKKRPPKPPPLITPTPYHNNLPIIDLSLYASIAARNCHQWAHAVGTIRNIQQQLGSIAAYVSLNTLEDQNEETLLDEGMWHNILGHGETCNVLCQYTILISDWVKKRTPIEATWQRAVMATTKIEGTLPEEIQTIKNNPPEPIELDWDAKPIINFLEPEEFHKHYQNLAPTREEQKQWLAQLNTRLCCHCLISSDFEYCDDCDLIYNPPPRMIYSIPKEEEPISSCASESELLINCDSDSDDNDKNTGFSSIQNGNDDENDSDSDSKPDLNYKQYIALPDLSKEQELKWYSNNGEGIMPERAHDMDAGFDLRYPRKDAIKLESHSCTCIDLKIALEILTTTMVQLASRSSLAKREINIRGGIIDTGYVGNIIMMLQNNSEKTYIIEPNEKIAQAIFLLLLVSVRKREELGITVRGIQRFGSMDRIDVPVNIVKEEIVGQGEIISTSQAISIPPYSQYMLAIERKEKEQEQIFEAEANLCESGEIGLINLYIPAKSYSSIKIPIYNNTGNIINISEGTTIGYLTTEIENQPPNPIPDFPQLCEYVDITSQTIYG
ncbi:hypothetical protein G9A89_017050 [Geosiphon pyriformis]|nr:hypothetical protein G9A89_017050 [Geosiphon pyriformis]